MKTRILSVAFLFFSFYSYSSDVNQEWYKSVANKNGRVDLLVKTDSEGYIYIAGTFDSGSNGADWRLTKISPNGDTIFNKVYNGSYWKKRTN